MDKLYYASSDGTVRGSDGELYHWGWKKKDAKYIKREWKNGKWVYTYPSDTKSDTTSKKNEPKKSGSTVMDKLAKWFGADARKARDAAETKVKQDTYSSKIAAKKYKEARDSAASDMYITDSEYLNVNMKNVAKSHAEKKLAKSGEDYVKANEEFAKTPLGKLEKVGNTIKEYVNSITEERKTLETWFKEGIEYKKERERQERQAEEEQKRQESYDTAVVETRKANKFKDSFNAIVDALRKHNPFPKLFVKEHPHTPDQDMALVNPNYRSGERQKYDENCAACTLTYDLRRRGYDVEVLSEQATSDDGTGNVGMTFKDILSCYKNVPETNISVMPGFRSFGHAIIEKNNISENDVRKSLKTLESELLKYGDGARGNFCVYWRAGGGHSVVWEVENGKVVIRDSQVNKTHTLEDYASNIFYFESVRTDNVEPSERITQYVKNREREE